MLKLPQIWLVDNIDDKEQKKAPQGTIFIPISQFPIKKIRKDCTYLSTPAMKIPETMQNIHACEVRKIIKRVLKRAKHYAAISFIKFEQIKIEISDKLNFF